MEKRLEVRQAQVAAFASERIEHYADRRRVFAALSEIALSGCGAEEIVPDEFSSGAVSQWQYVDYLRHVGGRRHEKIRGRVELLENYSVFAGAVDDLRAALDKYEDPEQHLAFLGKGSNSRVYAVDVGNTLYAIRIPKPERTDPGVIDGHIAAALLGRWAPHLEQIVAASYEQGVTVAEMVPGVDMGHISIDEIQCVQGRQIEDLIDTLQDTQERGINIDPKPSNVLYDLLEGYGIVDYQAPDDFAFQGVGETVASIASALGRAGLYGKQLDYEKRETYQYVQAVQLANLVVVQRYQAAARERLHSDDYEVAAGKIESILATIRAALQECGDPQAVEARIDRTKKLRESRMSSERRLVIRDGNVQTIG